MPKLTCVKKEITDKITKAVNAGRIKPEKLIKISSEDRIEIFAKEVGEKDAIELNNRFLDKNKIELTDSEMQVIKDSIDRINREKENSPIKTVEDWKNMKEIPKWAEDYIQLNKTIEDIISPESKYGITKTVTEGIKKEYNIIMDKKGIIDKGIAIAKLPLKAAFNPVYKATKASIDLSFALRQGFKIFTKSPKQWGKSMLQAFSIVKKTLDKEGMDKVMDTFRATYLAHPNYEVLVNDAKVAFGVVEDFFPTPVTDKIPVLGNLFKSSNDAFTIFSQSARFGLADAMLEKQINKKIATLGKGESPVLSKRELESIGTVANSITGRGSLGKLEKISSALNDIFFSARYVKSAVDTFTMPFNTELSPFARKEAMMHSIATFGTIFALVQTASYFGQVETDPRSSKFLWFKPEGSKDWIDLSAGLGKYITLGVKELPNIPGTKIGGYYKTKSGKLKQLNDPDEFKGDTRFDALMDFMKGKLSPALSVFTQAYLEGQMYGGEKPTVENVVRGLIAPITADNFFERFEKDEDILGLITLLDTLGAGVDTGK